MSSGLSIDHWVELASKACADVLARNPEFDGDELPREVEPAPAKASLNRRNAFPVVAEAVAKSELTLHGAWFGIALGALLQLDRASGEFQAIPAHDLARSRSRS